MYDSSPRLCCAFLFSPTSKGFAFVEFVGMEGFEGIPASHILLSQKPDPKENQVINLDQDVQVHGYFWWMVYELLCTHHLSFFFFLDKGLSFIFPFF